MRAKQAIKAHLFSEQTTFAPQIARFIVLRELGRGGMGVVYVAYDETLDRRVALKLLYEMQGDDTERQSRLLREAQAMARLNHPNIAAVYEAGTHEGRVYVAMEFIQGQPLDVWLREKPRPWREVVDVFIQAGRGLHAAHCVGLVHRDFKPANVMLGRDGRVRVLDFGLARGTRVLTLDETLGKTALMSVTLPVLPQGGPLTREGMIVGTPAYMPPEQFRGHPIDPRADQYALCVSLYEGVYGRLPFRGETLADLWAAVLAGPPKAAPPKSSRAPGWLHRILLRGLSPDPIKRFPSMAALFAAFEHGQRRAWRYRLAGVIAVLALSALVTAVLASPAAEAPSPPQDSLASIGGVPASIAAVHRQVTFTGDASVPALSPDGEHLAYESRPGQRSRLVVQHLATGRSRVLTWWNDEILSIQWSGDGSRLFVNLAGSAYIVPVYGGQRLYVRAAGGFHSWASDGSAYVETYQNPNTVLTYDVTRAQATNYRLDMPSFTWIRGLAWPPSRGFILLATQETLGFALWTVRFDGSPPRKIHEDRMDLSEIRWSAGSDDMFTVQRFRGQASEIVSFRLRPDGDAEELGTLLSGEFNRGYARSADGKRLAYIKTHRDVNLVRLSRLDITRLTSGTQVKYKPTPAPDGSSVAFVMGSSDIGHIFVLPIQGGEPKRVTSESGPIGAIAWSPDARQLAYTQIIGQTPELKIVDVETGTVRSRVVEDLSRRGHIIWAPGRDILYHVFNHTNYMLLDPENGDRRPLVPAELLPQYGWMFSPTYSPDGQQIAVSYNRYPRGLWAISLTTGESVLIAPGRLTPLGWSRDGRSILAHTDHEIVSVARATGASRTLLSIPVDRHLSDLRHIPGTPGSFVAIDDRSTSDIWITGDFADDAIATVVPPPTEPIDAQLPPGYPATLNRTPVNLDLEAGSRGTMPPGWHLDEASRMATAVTTETQSHRGVKAVRLDRGQIPLDKGDIPADLMQVVDATPYRGKRVRLRTALRAGKDARLGVWLRWERSNGRTMQATTTPEDAVTAAAWTTREVALEVPEDADLLAFGVQLHGIEGWLDTVRLEVVPRR